MFDVCLAQGFSSKTSLPPRSGPHEKMKDTAVSRTPVEIWTYILKMVINPPMGCYNNDNIAQDLRLFQVGCDSARAFIESEKYRTSLRLVCRSWNMVLKSEGFKLTIWHTLDTVLPSNVTALPAHRIQICSDSICLRHIGYRTSHPRGCPSDRMIKRQEDLGLQNQDNPKEEFDQLEALVLHKAGIKLEKLTLQAPRLRLLSWSSHEMVSRPTMSILSTFQNLSHLFIVRLTLGAFEGFRQYTILPNLIILSIQVEWDFPIKSETASLVGIEDRLPKLKRLDLHGRLLDEHWPYLKEFIIACSTTISELVFRILFYPLNNQKFRGRWGAIGELMDKMPHLTLYGTDWLSFIGTPSTRIKKRSLTLLVANIADLMARRVPAEEFEQVVGLLGVENLMVDERWYDLREKLDKEVTSSILPLSLKTFGSSLTRLMEQGIVIRDIDGVPLTGLSGRGLLEWLEDLKQKLAS